MITWLKITRTSIVPCFAVNIYCALNVKNERKNTSHPFEAFKWIFIRQDFIQFCTSHACYTQLLREVLCMTQTKRCSFYKYKCCISFFPLPLAGHTKRCLTSEAYLSMSIWNAAPFWNGQVWLCWSARRVAAQVGTASGISGSYATGTVTCRQSYAEQTEPTWTHVIQMMANC